WSRVRSTTSRAEMSEREGRETGAGESPLARIAFIVYVVLTAYASLYPLEGWRGHGLSPFEYLMQPWPRQVYRFDMTVNVLGDVRDFLAAPQGRARTPEFFVTIEAFTAGANFLSVAFLVSALVSRGVPGRVVVSGLLAGALAIKTAAFALLMRAENPLIWLTP